MPSSPFAARMHWAAPFLVAAVIGLVAVIPTLSAGAATPSLPQITAERLLVNVQQTKVQWLSGTIRLTTNLGIPNLGALAEASGRGSGFNPTDLLAGSHQADVWFDGPDRQKITMVSTLAETDVIHNGQDVWTWQSAGSKVDHVVLAGHEAAGASKPHAKPDATPDPAAKAGSIETPDQAAKALLAQIDPSTAVSVSKPIMVAGHKAYELVLKPRSTDPKMTSTVDHAAIAVDSTTGLPLRVSLFAVGQSKPAFELGFTKLKYDRPAASTFKFTPPPGATVTTNGSGTPPPAAPRSRRHAKEPANITADPTPSAGAGKTQHLGKDWTQVVIFSNSGQLPRQANALLESAPRVTATFGGARLVHTALLNILVLDDGRIAVGAVTVDSLKNAVASAH